MQFSRKKMLTRLSSARNCAPCQRVAGFGLVEVVVSILITAVLLSAALKTVSASRRRELNVVEQSHAFMLANDLMHEILQQVYVEPVQVATFGPEAGEQNGTRLLYDDVDDYHGLNTTPPKDRSGITLAGYGTMSRSVTVEYVSALPPHGLTASDSGLKRITVQIRRGSLLLASIIAYRSAGFQNKIEP